MSWVRKRFWGEKWGGRYFDVDDVDPNQKEIVCPINEELLYIMF